MPAIIVFASGAELRVEDDYEKVTNAIIDVDSKDGFEVTQQGGEPARVWPAQVIAVRLVKPSSQKNYFADEQRSAQE